MILINNLVKLQEIDSAIMAIEELQGDLPTYVEELSSTLTSLEKGISSAEERLLEIELEIRKMQTLEQDHKEKISTLRVKEFGLKEDSKNIKLKIKI